MTERSAIVINFATGTVEYMAPEIFACYITDASCFGRVRKSLDVYSFGVVFWELLHAHLDIENVHGETSNVQLFANTHKLLVCVTWLFVSTFLIMLHDFYFSLTFSFAVNQVHTLIQIAVVYH